MSESDSDSDSISQLIEESESSPESSKHSTMEDMSDSESHTEENNDADHDVDDQEDQTDEGKYSAPKFLREHVDKVVDEIRKIVAQNANELDLLKESRRSSIGRNSITTRKSQSISPKQEEIAEKMFVRMIVRKIPELRSQRFKYFDMFIIVPYFHSLGKL